MAVSRAAASPSPNLGAHAWEAVGSRRLARRAAAGDKRAFAKIFERHHQELYRYCLAILRNPTDAEDALQATMSKALQALPGEQRQIQLRPWLFRVAHNESISILRGRRADLTDGGADPDTLATPGPEVQAERSERLRTLVEDLQVLPERQCSALVMRELSGLGYGEIATALGCTEGAARQTVYEARSALQVREEGRQMECEEARRAISDGDRRRLRGRRLRAHLTGCDGCRGFEAAIVTRSGDLSAIAPPLPAAAAAGVFAAVGGSSAGAGLAGVGGAVGSLAAGLGASGAAKGLSLAAAVVIAAGAGQATGVIDVAKPFGSGDSGQPASSPTPAVTPGGSDSAGRSSAESGRAAKRSGPPAVTDRGSSAGKRKDGARGRGGRSEQAPPPHSNAGGKDGSRAPQVPPGLDSNPGKSGTAPGKSGSSPGKSETAPGKSGSAPPASGPKEKVPPISTPPHSSGGGNGKLTAPGQAKSKRGDLG
jgi:RNA polymerase sigma factor (sigma-70 family)